MKKTIYFLLALIVLVSCQDSKKEAQRSEMENWKTNWRMINAVYFHGEMELGAQYFDTLLASAHLKTEYLINGLEILNELGRKEKLDSIFHTLDTKTLQEIRNKEKFVEELKGYEIYEATVAPKEIQNPALQLEIIKMYVKDQAVRGNVMHNIIAKYELSEDDIIADDATAIDAYNRERLKVIIAEYGFPTKELIGKDAMHAVFLFIQHADRDKEWQKSQLPNVEKAVKQGDLEGKNYAYLYDRIKRNNGEKQLYGTQFSEVNRDANTAVLAPTEDLENLDQRRMEMGMMPIEVYKNLMVGAL